MIAASRLPVPVLGTRPWLLRHRTEGFLLAATLALLVAIWWHLQHSGPAPQDIVRAVERYAARIQSTESLRTGSLGTEMRTSIFAPSLRHLEISDQRRFPGYWSIDAVLELDQPLGLPMHVPVRLRVSRVRVTAG